MKKSVVLDGFHEASIDFPPTFKYDVQRSRRPNRSKILRPEKQISLQMDEGQAEVVEEEATDVASLSSASTHSKVAVEQAWEDVSNQTGPSTPNLVESDRKLLMTNNGTKQSRSKWLSILSPSIVTTPRLPRFSHIDPLASPLSPSMPHPTPSSLSPQSVTTLKIITAKKRFRPPPMVLTPSSVSQNSIIDGDPEEEKGVYDTSSKQRVPSWSVKHSTAVCILLIR